VTFFNKFRRWIRLYARRLFTLPDELAETKMLMGRVLTNQIRARGALEDIREAEFKVFSQFGEDGILQYIIRETRLPRALWTFVEFGVESYVEANTRFLLVSDNWRGLVIDGNSANIAKVKENPFFWRHDLNAVAAFVDADNINRLISEGGYSGEIGILSVDIDGNDYWVWDRIDVVNPVIVVAEYNSVFGPDRAVTIPYDPGFVRGKAHHSHLYWGCSLKALELLGRKKGYALVGSNSAGNNAFFVRRDSMRGLTEVTAEKAYVESRFRESRDAQGRLTYLTGRSRLREIGDLPVCDVERNAIVQLREISK
jgi:hypothetical protein